MKSNDKVKTVKIRKKLSAKAKKIIVLGCFCALLLVTGAVNIYINSLTVNEASANVQSTASFFSNYKNDRESTRSQEILYLDAIIASESSSQEAKTNAENERLRIVSNMDMISNIETLIKSKGFSEVAVSASTNNITVMVETAGLTSGEVAQIVDVVKNNSDYSIDNIKIIEV